METLGIVGGRVLRPDMTVVEADVLADRERGRIEAVGEPARGADETLDAGGCLVLPGLVNAHCHVAMTLLRGYADDTPLDPWLREVVWPVESVLEPDDVRAGARLGLLEMIRNGVTAIEIGTAHV